MSSLWTAMRALVYTTLFVWLWGWVALNLRPYDSRLGGALGPWAVPLGWTVTAMGAALAASCVWTFIRRGQGTPAPFDAPRQVVAAGPSGSCAIPCTWAASSCWAASVSSSGPAPS